MAMLVHKPTSKMLDRTTAGFVRVFSRILVLKSLWSTGRSQLFICISADTLIRKHMHSLLYCIMQTASLVCIIPANTEVILILESTLILGSEV